MLESLKQVIGTDRLTAAVKHVIYEMIDVCTDNGISLTEMDSALASIHEARGGGGMGYVPEQNCIAIDENRAGTAYGGRTDVFYFRGLLHEVGHFQCYKRADKSETGAWRWVQAYLNELPSVLRADREVAVYMREIDQLLNSGKLAE